MLPVMCRPRRRRRAAATSVVPAAKRSSANATGRQISLPVCGRLATRTVASSAALTDVPHLPVLTPVQLRRLLPRDGIEVKADGLKQFERHNNKNSRKH